MGAAEYPLRPRWRGGQSDFHGNRNYPCSVRSSFLAVSVNGLTEAPANSRSGFCDWVTVLVIGGRACNSGSHLLHVSAESLPAQQCCLESAMEDCQQPP